MTKGKPLKVIELFAGVGGFRLGLEGEPGKKNEGNYEVVWSNQWEPTTKQQHASDIYKLRFSSKGHSNEDITKVSINDIPDHDLLVGGFPCQDYSVARTLSKAEGLVGKKGVLWWQIHRILKEKGQHSPNYLFLENVDRLLKSPAKQRGRDFGIMLASLSDLGYIVEWRVINAADYGMPQRRRRVYILAYKKGSEIYKRIIEREHLAYWFLSDGPITKAFPIIQNKTDIPINEGFFKLEGDLFEISGVFKGDRNMSPFQNTGIMKDREVFTIHTAPKYSGERQTLGQILQKESEVPLEYYIDEKDIPRWKYLKGAKKELRKSSGGFEYNYSEGSMSFPDLLDKPSRTIITGEGGATPSRFKHVIKTKIGKYRRLTPIELEKLNMFPVNHTKGVPDSRRAFFMGNALVVGVVDKIGKALFQTLDEAL
ncbi:MAG: DNA (cytosine-5-)-methyltransferase [bacterium]|nr:DNA (cytosine-5-)-methyltransferase [bacterium]